MGLAPAARRREQNRSDARRTILDSTEALLLEEGEDKFSVRKLVERCGYTAPTIYHYFGDKSGLLAELLEQRTRGLVVSLREVSLVDDPVENLRALFRAFAEFFLRNPTHYHLLSESRASQTDALPSVEEARALLMQPLELLDKQGRLHGNSLDETRQVTWSFLHGTISLQWIRPDEDWVPNLLDAEIDAMIRGCVRPPTHSSAREGNSS